MSLPEGWSQHQTVDGRLYFHNRASGVTQWTAPAGTAEKKTGAVPMSTSAAGVVSQTAPSSSVQAVGSSAPKLPEGWKEFQTKTGRAYYHNTATGVTVWHHPGLPKAESAAVKTEPTRSATEAGKFDAAQQRIYDELDAKQSKGKRGLGYGGGDENRKVKKEKKARDTRMHPFPCLDRRPCVAAVDILPPLLLLTGTQMGMRILQRGLQHLRARRGPREDLHPKGRRQRGRLEEVGEKRPPQGALKFSWSKTQPKPEPEP